MIVLLCSAAGLFLFSFGVIETQCNETGTRLPNIGYLGRGYDIVHGNPIQSGIDEGYRHSVYDLRADGNLTPDQRFLLPAKVFGSSCISCNLKFSTNVITGETSYQNSLRVLLSRSSSVGVEGLGKAEFSASVDYRNMRKETHTNRDVMFQSYATCEKYCAAIQHYERPELTSNFRRAVSELPTTYKDETRDAFGRFFSSFGTHIVDKVTMGALYGSELTISSSSYTKLSMQGVDVSLAAKASATIKAVTVEASTKFLTSVEKQQAEKLEKSTKNERIFTKGSKPPVSGDAVAWAQNVITDPMPIKQNLVLILDVLTKQLFPADSNIDAKYSAVKNALKDYCYRLPNSNQCQPSADNALPAPPAFGGMYQFDDCYHNHQPNPYTENYNCPIGFTSHQYGRLMTPESKCGANLFFCYNKNATNDNQFGGLYQSFDTDSSKNINNPLTNGQSCPTGFRAHQIGRVTTAEPRYYGSNIFICANLDSRESFLRGFFQRGDYGGPNSIVNPVTNTLTCDPGSKAYSVVRGRMPEHNYNGGEIVICLAGLE